MVRIACNRCLDAITAGMPFHGSALQLFFAHTGWYAQRDTRELFVTDVRAGYIELNMPNPLVRLPLERAVGAHNLEVFNACLDARADQRLVPSSPSLSSGGLIRHIRDLTDITAGPAAQEMPAAVTQAAMRRQITGSGATAEHQVDMPNTGAPDCTPARAARRRARVL